LVPRKGGGKTVEQSAEPFPTPTIPSPREALAFRAKLVAEQAAQKSAPAPEAVPEEVLVQKRLEEIEVELAKAVEAYRNISYLEGVSGRLALLDKINALEVERARLKSSGWPKKPPQEAPKPIPAYRDDARWLLGGQGGAGAAPAPGDVSLRYGRSRYEG